MEVEEQIEEVKGTCYSQKQKEYMAKMMGCNKDHAKEIDLYSKSYAEKIERIRTQMKQAQQAMEAANEATKENNGEEE